VNFITISVIDTKGARAAEAANVLADILIRRISGFRQGQTRCCRRSSATTPRSPRSTPVVRGAGGPAAIARGPGTDAQKARRRRTAPSHRPRPASVSCS
jgi:hypothetical protein